MADWGRALQATKLYLGLGTDEEWRAHVEAAGGDVGDTVSLTGWRLGVYWVAILGTGVAWWVVDSWWQAALVVMLLLLLINLAATTLERRFGDAIDQGRPPPPSPPPG